MRIRRLGGTLAVGIALTLTGCGGEDDPNLVDVEPADFPPFSSMYELAAAETIRVGIIGNEVDSAGTPASFEVRLGEMIAGALGIPAQAITWVRTEPAEHERLIEDGLVDIVLAAFAIDERSLQIVDFAGPYYVGGQSLLVSPESGDPTAGSVCTTADVAESLPLVDADIVVDHYSACLDRLRAGEVDAVSAPDLTVAAEIDGRLSLAGEPLTSDEYGIGLAKGDDEFRAFLNDVLETVAADGRWTTAWESTAGTVLGSAQPPAVDRY